MNANTLRAFLVFLGLFAAIGGTGWLLKPYFFGGGASRGSAEIALVYVEGVISGSGGSGGGLLGGNSVASSVDLCDQLYSIRDDDSIKGVLLRINSPGGAAAASDEVYCAVKALRESGKPVVVSMGDVAASGGYYIASAADYIFANGATLTGSIGVVFSLYNWEEAAAKLGIKDETLTAGQYKDIGSPWRGLRDDEAGMLTELMHEVHNQFITAVAEGRANLTEDQVREVATGMVFTGERAVALGLVDEVGGLREAENKVRELAQVAADTVVEPYRQPSLWEELFTASGPNRPFGAELVRSLGTDALSRLAGGLYLDTTLRDLVLH